MSKQESAPRTSEASQPDTDAPKPATSRRTRRAEPDPHHGRGGSYVRDPHTGERKLVARTKT